MAGAGRRLGVVPLVVVAGVVAGVVAAACSPPAAEPSGADASAGRADSSVTTSPGAPSPSPTIRATPAPTSTVAPTPEDRSPREGKRLRPDRRPRVVETLATGLAAPWGLDFLADGDALVTERDSARVLRIAAGTGTVEQIGTLDGAAPEGEGGALGLAISPGSSERPWVYVYLTTLEDNRIVRARLDGAELGEPQVVLAGIPRGFIHDGGRLVFGPDGYLYASTGETGDPTLAQDRSSLAGKVLRITPEGRPAPGNPFGSPVWSWGHRNVQGLAFDDAERLWASEFGADTADELNLIRAGANYGWPLFEGNGGQAAHAAGFVDPLRTWPTAEASPAGLAHADGALWMGALRGERLWRIPLDGRRTERPEALFTGEYGRLRTVAAAPDGALWVMTSNRDGRGEPAAGDDRILRVAP